MTAVRWDAFGLLVVVQSRAQDRMRILDVDPDTGRTRVLREDVDPAWVTIVPGVPARTGDGALVWTADTGATRHLVVDGETVTPQGLQVREVLDVDDDTVLFLGSDDPVRTQLWTWSRRAGRYGSATRLACTTGGGPGGPRSSRARVWRTPVPG